MADLTDADLTRLRETAEAATQGAWRWSGGMDSRAVVLAPDATFRVRVDGHPDAEHIAAFDPPTVHALLDHIATLTAERDAAVRAHADLVAALRAVMTVPTNAEGDYRRGMTDAFTVIDTVLADHTDTACSGAGDCTAPFHVHGCYADLDGNACTDPADHAGTHDVEEVDPYDEPVRIQGHMHSEPICAWPECKTYLTREQMASLHRDGGEGRG